MGLLNDQTRHVNVGVTSLACSLLCDSLTSSVAQNLLSCAPLPAMSHTQLTVCPTFIQPLLPGCVRVSLYCCDSSVDRL